MSGCTTFAVVCARTCVCVCVCVCARVRACLCVCVVVVGGGDVEISPCSYSHEGAPSLSTDSCRSTRPVSVRLRTLRVSNRMRLFLAVGRVGRIGRYRQLNVLMECRVAFVACQVMLMGCRVVRGRTAFGWDTVFDALCTDVGRYDSCVLGAGCEHGVVCARRRL